MAKITKLSEAQEKRLIEFREEWRQHGLCCKPADWEAAEEQIAYFYERLGKPKPMFFRFSSPLMCELGIAALKVNLDEKNFKKLRSQLGSQLGSQLESQLGSQLESQLGSQLGSQLWSQLGSQLWSQLGSQLRSQLESQLRSQLESQLRSQLGSQLESRQFWYNSFGGQHAAGWKAFYLFCHEIGVKYDNDDLKLLNAWGVIAQSVCWWAPWEGICILSDRPRHVSFDEDRRLHNERGMAVQFSDGWGVHAWHGTIIPAEWVEDRASLTPEIALKWDNVEQRRAACEIIGWNNVLEHPSLNPRIIDQDLPHIGTLIEVDLPDAPAQRFIKYQCGTGRYFAESVNDKSFDTALKANAGGNGWRGQGDPENFIPFYRT